ncbi:MAG: HEPN domain-containing protein [Nanoarchaeota archaeon]
MKKEDKLKATIRLKDADEFLASSKDNLNLGRFKASLDHAIDAVIAANDAFTIYLIEQVASANHHEAITLHKLAGQKISENKANEIAELLEERHRKTYRTVSVNRDLAELIFKRAKRFLDWVKNKIK